MKDSRSKERRIVAIGGGAGMRGLLKGLTASGADLCAIITVADDGGSSGRLRKDFNIPPPGAIRNCLVAMSECEPILGDLFEYRFEDSYLKDHSFGNLFLAALTRLTGNFGGAIEQARKLLEVRGRVIPATERKITLVAKHPGGGKSTGQVVIAECQRPIESISLVPRPPEVSEAIKAELESADLICVGPGKLYTEVVPNLLVPGMVEAINAAGAPVLNVANLMSEPGQTEGFTLADHLKVLRELAGGLEVSMVLAPADTIDEEQRARYAESGSAPITATDTEIDGIPVHSEELLEPGAKVRHSPERLAQAVFDCHDLILDGKGAGA